MCSNTQAVLGLVPTTASNTNCPRRQSLQNSDFVSVGIGGQIEQSRRLLLATHILEVNILPTAAAVSACFSYP